ncbi:MAG: helix-turn-helix domain-containing protein [Pyrinomonadaceae bacterium]|nr:helix-turn-helix domain-containing protein [Pyrinomonadaceae bacterium]
MERKQVQDRIRAIERYQRGESVTAIARSMGYSPRWIYKWVTRYQRRSETVQWAEDQSSRPCHNPRQISNEIVEAIKLVRLSLYNQGLFCGAQAIEWELESLGVAPVPSLPTINRILSRHELTHRRTGRYESKGRKYPKLSSQTVNEVHQMDYVGPYFLKGPVRFYSLNSVDLATGRCAISPVLSKAGQHTLDAIWSSWCRLGIPQNVQIDNEMVFYGSRQYPRGMGILIRLCLLNDVQPWFIPVAEPWRNGVIEKFNDHFQTGFLRRIVMRGEKQLRRQSLAFEEKHNTRYRYSKLKGQTPQACLTRSHQKVRFPDSLGAPCHPLPKPDRGRYHLVRFIRSDGVLDVFGEKYSLPPEAAYEYVVATVDVALQKLIVQIEDQTLEEYKYAMT